MFDALADKLQSALGDLKGRGTLDDETITRAMREVRLALLEADVNFDVVKQFVAQVRERALGADVQKSLTPGQQVVKIVHEELTELMGSGSSQIAFSPRPPTTILLAGLQGSGKTTAAGKLAGLLARQGLKPALVACDLQRPAAVEQLKTLGRQLDMPVFSMEGKDPVTICREAGTYAAQKGCDVIIYDTAGRLAIDEPLMQELEDINRSSNPANVFLVLDAMTGQDAVNVAETFNQRLNLDGVIMTKLDGDARGGAALSVKEITGKPIKFLGMGESLDKLEEFRPEGLASRILGMGDIVGLVQSAMENFDQEETAKLQAKMEKGTFTLEDFIAQMGQVKKMGPMSKTRKASSNPTKAISTIDDNSCHQYGMT